MELLPMASRHLDEVAGLEALCFARPWSRDGLAAELDNPHAVFRVALEAGRVVGYAGMHAVAGECYIANVAVNPAARGRGVARALVDCLVNYAQEQGCAFITLEVRPSNAAALALYHRCGFAEAGRRRNFYENPREDALLMTLVL